MNLCTVVLLLAGLLGTLAAAGCGGADGTAGNGNGTAAGSTAEGGENSGGGVSGTGEKAMGRYVESVNDFLRGQTFSGSRMVRQTDGTLVVISPGSGKWVSDDNGISWEQQPLPWQEELIKTGYIRDAALSADGWTAIIYEEDAEGGEDPEESKEGEGLEPKESKEGEGLEPEESKDGEGLEPKGSEDGEGLEPKEKEGGEKQTGERTEEEGKEDGEQSRREENAEGDELRINSPESELPFRCFLISPKQEIEELEIPYEPDGWLRNLFFSDDGRLFASAVNGKVYEFDREQGSCEMVGDFGEWVQHLTVWKERMVCITSDEIILYDLAAGEVIEDKVLDEFVETQIGEKLRSSDGYSQSVLVIPEADDSLYLIFEKGIYRHVLGGNLVEQLADGTINSLSNPSWKLGDGMLLEDGTFLLLLANGQLASYAYDADMPSVPEIRLKAYSLVENSGLKMAIASYQAEHPEVYIRYEIGMDADSSATKEDALKKLNTEIAAGNAPDFFLLDGMPIDSYVEKGILADITPVLDALEAGMEESGAPESDAAGALGDVYLQNILRAFEVETETETETEKGTETEGRIYAVPALFSLPLVGGRAEEIEQMKDLAAIADLVEQCREEKPEGGIMGVLREKDLIRQFVPVCAPAWVGEDGKLQEDRLEEFFMQMQRIWNVEKEAVTEKQKEELEAYTSELAQYGMTEKEIDLSRINGINWQGERYMTGQQEFVFGRLESSFDFDWLISFFHIKERLDGDFAAYGGQADGVFIPNTIAGISRTTEHPEIAAGLLEKLIKASWGEFVTNKEKLRESLLVNATEDGGSYGSVTVMKEDGTSIGYNIYPASEEEIQRLIRIAEQAKTPYVENDVLEDAVCEAGEKVLKGEITVREGVEEVKKRVSLSMAE